MRYPNICSGIFVSRPNRFIAMVDTGNGVENVHVKNTGRCRELLIPGCRVWLCRSDNPERKTKYDLVAVDKLCRDSTVTVNIDSQAPNAAAEEWLRSGGLFGTDAVIRREVTRGGSRFDFCVEQGGRISFLEVKGVTLEQDGIAMFPDAPTQRGVKHVTKLIDCAREGLGAYILFVIQMKGVHLLRPNDDTHRAFGDALRQAAQSGVQVLAMDCRVTPDTMTIDAPVPVEL